MAEIRGEDIRPTPPPSGPRLNVPPPPPKDPLPLTLRMGAISAIVYLLEKDANARNLETYSDDPQTLQFFPHY